MTLNARGVGQFTRDEEKLKCKADKFRFTSREWKQFDLQPGVNEASYG